MSFLPKPYLAFLDVLRQIQEDAGPSWRSDYGLDCQTRDWLDSAVLKLQKKKWTDGGFGEGVFFSVWISAKDLKKGRFNYNIHALKLSKREGYAIKPREFAGSFRSKLLVSGADWPNLSTDFGPQTLMQGWRATDLADFRSHVLALVETFVSMHGVIDDLLAERRK